MTLESLMYLLAHDSATCRRLVGRYPTLLRDVFMMEDYEAQVRMYQLNGTHAARTRARYEITERYRIDKKTFEKILVQVRSLPD